MTTKRSGFCVVATVAALTAVFATPASAAGNGGLSWFSAIIDWFSSMTSF